MQDFWDAKVWKQMFVEGFTHASCMLAFQWVCEIELGPVVHTVQDPVVYAMWEMAHVDEVNLRKCRK